MREMRILNTKAIRLIEYTLVIGGSFYLGILFYPFSLNSTEEIEILTLKEFAPNIESAIKKELILNTGSSQIRVQGNEINEWVETYQRNYSGKYDKRLSYALVSDYLKNIAPRLNTEPVNAKLKFQNNRAGIFQEPIHGKRLNIEKSANAIFGAILSNLNTASLSFDIIEPEITLEKINNLGINALIGKGDSDYGKSPTSRINNIKIGMAKFNGIIIKPDEEFSFNNLLGEVDDKNGYQAELVIKSGELVREFGGGLCQVSTTVFRAAIMAGFPITERRSHSFPVQYYNPQGFDSTIYPGVIDLKFINNTPNHILIQTKVIGSHLSVEIYGSDDGRKVSMEGPFQYEHQSSGAMKAYFARTITLADGTKKEERFNSIYKAPPQSPLEKNPLE